MMELHKKPLEVGYMDENHDISDRHWTHVCDQNLIMDVTYDIPMI